MDLHSLPALCQALALDPGRHGLHVASASAPTLDPATPTLLLDPLDDALLAAIRDRYPADHPLRLARFDSDRVLLSDTTPTAITTDQTANATALYLPPLPAEADLRHARGLMAIVHRLRDPDGGCPWDLEQTHDPLKSDLLEETYEALEALDRGDPASLKEELGDILLQVVLHARIAEQTDEFTTADVLEGVSTKLIRRHPHVFGDVTAATTGEVLANWNRIKRKEREATPRADASALAGVSPAMPALAYSQAILGRAERAGFAWTATTNILAKVTEEARELVATSTPADRRHELGDLLLALVSLARALELEAEEALRMAAARFSARFRHMEAAAGSAGPPPPPPQPAALLRLWEGAKRAETPS